MGSDIYTAASGAIARMHDLDVTANNLANVDTPGYHRDLTVFEVALESALRAAEGGTVKGPPARAMVGIASSSPDTGSGALTNTGAPLDAAILGPGWFEIATPDGLRYTRAGSFGVDPQRRIVTPDGHPLQGDGGAIRIGAGTPEITGSGEVRDSTGASLGRIRVVDFLEPSGLVKEGRNLYRTLPEAGPFQIENPLLAERTLERSNVVAVAELGRLVQLQRAFDASMQMMTQQDRATERLLREVGS